MTIPTPDIQDLRRDAEIVLQEQIAVHILDLGLEDVPTEDDIRMLNDFSDEEVWTGLFANELNSEKLYEVTYRYSVGKFFITTFLMTYCNKVDPPHEY